MTLHGLYNAQNPQSVQIPRLEFWNSGLRVTRGGCGAPCRRAPITKCLVLSMPDLVWQGVVAVFAEGLATCKTAKFHPTQLLFQFATAPTIDFSLPLCRLNSAKSVENVFSVFFSSFCSV